MLFAFVFQRKMNFSLFSLSILLVVQKETQTKSVIEIVPLKIVLSIYELKLYSHDTLENFKK